MLPDHTDVPSAFVFGIFIYITIFVYVARRVYLEGGYAEVMDLVLDVAIAIQFEHRCFCQHAFMLRWI
jgi:hypothetical protein